MPAYSHSQTPVDICNSALVRLGANTIRDIHENSREARVCQVQYDSTRRSELRAHKWKFALAQAVLAPDANQPDFRYRFRFPLPADCLRVCKPDNSNFLDWEIQGRAILTNHPRTPFYNGIQNFPQVEQESQAPQLLLTYIRDEEDVTKFDPSFYDVVCLALAVDICEALTQSTSKRQALNQEYQQAVVSARHAQAFETFPQDFPLQTWELGRLNNGWLWRGW